MKFLVNITGDFENVKGLVIAQKYFMSVECGSCRTLHKNAVFISDEMLKKVKVKDVKGMVVKFNLTLKCKNCDGVMGINIYEPENKVVIDPETEYFVHPVENDVCTVSIVQSDSAVIKDVDGLILDAVSFSGDVFKNCSINQHIVAEEREGRSLDIQRFKVEVVQVQ